VLGENTLELGAFRSDKGTSNLLLDGNIGKRGPNCDIVHAVHLSTWRVISALLN
jgi:hypothetical protein